LLWGRRHDHHRAQLDQYEFDQAFGEISLTQIAVTNKELCP
jgi:hypothetical protein